MRKKKQEGSKKELPQEITVKDWEKLMINEKEIKSKEDSQKIIQEMRYGPICG